MKKIIQIDSALPMDGQTWKVGKRSIDGLTENDHVITEIKDMTMEYEDHIDRQCDIYTSKGIRCSIINMPCVVYYEEESE